MDLEFFQEGERWEIALTDQPPDPDVSVLEVNINLKDQGWTNDFSPVSNRISLCNYITAQVLASSIINAFLDSSVVLAWSPDRARGMTEKTPNY